jgi:hypothetical protein
MSALPQAGFDEWYVFDEPAELGRRFRLGFGNTVRALSLMALLATVVTSLAAQVSQDEKSPKSQAPTVTSANDGIFAAFQTHPLVGIGDHHGMAQEEDFFASLIRDKRFATEVGNVVVEFGDAAQQGTVDRYLSGEDVPYEQLRKVWSDTVGWIPTVTALGYINFYAQVREVNQGLPPEQRIHVWLGDPPVDWSKIRSKSDWSQVIGNLFRERDSYPADLIATQILAKKKKALVIYGTSHLYAEKRLKALVEQSHPGAFFLVTPYSGFIEKSCSDAFEQAIHDWPYPALAFPVRDSNLKGLLRAPDCHFWPASAFSFPPNETDSEKAKEMADIEDWSSGGAGDALLYLGPATNLTQSPIAPDLYLDADFRKEIDRRAFMRNGQHLTWPAVRNNPVSPSYLHSYGDAGRDPK